MTNDHNGTNHGSFNGVGKDFAKHLIEMYGHGAEQRAIMRIAQMEEIGHAPSASLWREILSAVRELLTEDQPRSA